MENASRALLMAGGILLGILILSLMVTLFASSSSLSKTYDQSKQSETIQKFNTNFTQYVGHDLTIHQVLTIYNFAKQNGFKDDNNIEKDSGFTLNNEQIKIDLKEANTKLTSSSNFYKVEKIYRLEVVSFNADTGYISKIKFIQPANNFKCYKNDGSITYEVK